MSGSSSKPVRYYDRYAQSVVEEAIYGEAWLRWAYDNPLGRLTNSAVLRRTWFSVLFGAWMNTRASAARIAGFVDKFGIDMSQFEAPAAGWSSFNEFFIRPLAAGARPVDADALTVVFPADGRHTAFPDGADLSSLVVKGRAFTLAELLGDAALARRFEGGALVVSRLCPTDYHRFHFPVAGVAEKAKRLPGPLDSVSPVAIRAGARSLCANKRECTFLKTEPAGLVAVLEVGAACVGRIVQSYQPGAVGKGAEKGYFLFGGSTVITLFEPGRVTLAADMVEHSAQGMETYARMGDVMGRIKSA